MGCRRSTLLAALTALVCAVGALLAGPATASRGQGTTFEAPRELLDPAQRAATLGEISSLGARRLRVILYWRNVAPASDSAAKPGGDLSDPARYDWSRYEPLIADARARGFSVLLTVSGPVPKWATASKASFVNSPSASEFQTFMTAVGRKFAAQVSLWSIWNEPNHPDFLGPQYVKGAPRSGSLYRALFLAGWRGLRASGNGNDRVLLGETAPRGTGRVVAPLTFLRQTACLSSSYRKRAGCSNLPADGYAHHAYTTKRGPFFRPPGPNDVTIGVLSRLTRALDRAGTAGALRRGLGIYLTEFGIQSTPDPNFGVSLARQAEYQAISEKLAYDNPRVRQFSQYLMRDDDPGQGDERYGGFESGLKFADGRVKPAFAGFRLPLVAQRSGSQIALWGHVRPRRAQTTVSIQVSDGGRAFRRLKSVRTNSSGYFSTRTANRDGRRWRVVWGEFTGVPTRAYSRP